METQNTPRIIDLTGKPVTPENVARLAKADIIVIDSNTIMGWDEFAGRRTFHGKTFLAIDDEPKDDRTTEVYLYTGRHLTREDIYRAVRTRGNPVEIHAATTIRLPEGNVGTIIDFSREVKIGTDIEILIGLIGDITTDPTTVWNAQAEWRTYLFMNSMTMRPVNLPEDIKGSYRYIDTLHKTNAVVCRTTEGSYLGLITATGWINWGKLNMPITDELIQDTAKTFTTHQKPCAAHP